MAEQIDGKLRANPMKIGIAMVAAYLVDWSITDFDGKRVAIDTMSRDTLIDVLNDMDPAAFQIIHDAVDAHVVEVDAEREVEKNGQGDASKLSVISPSPVAATGDMSGSLN
jgi:hypothetical protein